MTTSLTRFLKASRGNVAILFGLLIVPLVSLSGAALDYSRANDVKTKLQRIADAAVMLAVTPSATNLTDADAKKRVSDHFQAEMKTVADMAGDAAPFTVVISRDATGARTARLQFSATVNVSFLKVLGMSNIPLGGVAEARGPSYPFMDMHVLLDNSPSMGLAASTAEIAKLEMATKSAGRESCAFACHDVTDSLNNYVIAKAARIILRIDVLKDAIKSLMDKSMAERKAPDRFRAALYTFGRACGDQGLTAIAPLTTDLGGVKVRANTIDMMPVDPRVAGWDRCTNYPATIGSLSAQLPPSGNGETPANPVRVVFVIGDGISNYDNPAGCTGTAIGVRCMEPILPAMCETLKSKGIKVAVLYTTYLPVPENDFYRVEVSPFISAVAPAMKACASEGLYAEVTPSQGPEATLIKLFETFLRQSRITT